VLISVLADGCRWKMISRGVFATLLLCAATTTGY